LAGTLVATWFAPEGDAEVGVTSRQERATVAEVGVGAVSGIHAAPGERRASTDAPGTTSLDVLSIRSRSKDDASDRLGALFSDAPWATKTVATVVESPLSIAPPEPPQAPPLPFKELGRYEEAGRTAVFLQHGDQNLVVHVGDTIADSYKVEEIAGSSITLRYLPLNQVQKLESGGAN
jgi:hypothetical protein